MNRTLLIIKPDATERNMIGYIINRLEKARFKIVAMKTYHLTEKEARKFYAVHEGKPFLDSLVKFMISGMVVPMVVEKEKAVSELRVLVGATDPQKAACGTIRYEIGVDIEKNSVHASDSDENALKEIAFFFEGH
ncbi:MAG: nucleoside-diphosphate kinase [FCB group bacterium]|nr:nucleoside-diphosphate kinase [FCB group bacterium]